MIVVADTSPLNYLVLTGYDHLLPKLFGAIFIPPAVFEELKSSSSPEPVHQWMDTLPEWVQVRAVSGGVPLIEHLGKGESEGIALAEALKADLVLIDDADACEEAEKRSLTVTGTLGVLRLAALQGMINLPEALARRLSTSFLCLPDWWRLCWPKLNFASARDTTE